jgi:hypothetical protein
MCLGIRSGNPAAASSSHFNQFAACNEAFSLMQFEGSTRNQAMMRCLRHDKPYHRSPVKNVWSFKHVSDKGPISLLVTRIVCKRYRADIPRTNWRSTPAALFKGQPLYDGSACRISRGSCGVKNTHAASSLPRYSSSIWASCWHSVSCSAWAALVLPASRKVAGSDSVA